MILLGVKGGYTMEQIETTAQQIDEMKTDDASKEALHRELAIERERLPDPAEGLRLERITYTSQGLRVKGYLVAGVDGRARPPLVYCRGGIRGVGMVRVPRLVTLARRGYTVFAPFYRGNEGGEGREDFGGED